MNDLKNKTFFDIGCGSGSYGKFLKKITGEYFSSYTGLDIYKNHNFPSEFNHINSTADNVNKYIGINENGDEICEHVEFNLNLKIFGLLIIIKSR